MVCFKILSLATSSKPSVSLVGGTIICMLPIKYHAYPVNPSKPHHTFRPPKFSSLTRNWRKRREQTRQVGHEERQGRTRHDKTRQDKLRRMTPRYLVIALSLHPSHNNVQAMALLSPSRTQVLLPDLVIFYLACHESGLYTFFQG